jgi:hypothetical protein
LVGHWVVLLDSLRVAQWEYSMVEKKAAWKEKRKADKMVSGKALLMVALKVDWLAR